MTRRTSKSICKSTSIFDVDRQIELLTQAKQHVETLCRQINIQNKCLETVYRNENCFMSMFDCLKLERKLQHLDSNNILVDDNMINIDDGNNSCYVQSSATVSFQRNDVHLLQRFARFDRNYQYLKKKCLKFSKLNTINSLYDIMYSLFENCGEFQFENKRKNFKSRTKKSSESVGDMTKSKRMLKSDDYNILLSLSKNPECFEKDGLQYFVCPLNDCRKIYKVKENLMRHVETHSPDSINNIEDSIKIESDSASIQMETTTLKKRVCKSANFESVKRKRSTPASGKQKKRKCQKKKQTQDAPIYHCEVDGCSYYSKYKSAIDLHKNKHSLDRPFQCEVCDKTFKNVYALRMHVLIHNNQRFECPFDGCNAIYSWYYTLKKHIRVHTNQAPIHRCDWPGCDYQSHRPDLLRKHRTRHTGERKYPCNWPDCGKAFKTESGLFDHLSMHKNERKHACTWPGCNYRCNLPGNLRKHIAIHEKKLAKTNNPIGNDPATMLVPQQSMLISDDDNLHF